MILHHRRKDTVVNVSVNKDGRPSVGRRKTRLVWHRDEIAAYLWIFLGIAVLAWIASL